MPEETIEETKRALLHCQGLATADAQGLGLRAAGYAAAVLVGEDHDGAARSW